MTATTPVGAATSVVASNAARSVAGQSAATRSTAAQATTAQAATTPAQTASRQAAASIAGDMQTFLKLLTTQLQNQDPTQPLDPNQLTQQLAQFAGVEQQIATNQHMEAMLGLQRSAALVSAAPMLGREVEVSSESLQLVGGAAQEVRLPALSAAAGATRARVVMTDSSGTLVREAFVPLGAAATAWNWDGKDARGRALPDGSYRMAVTGVDANGGTRGTLPAVVAGTVTGLSQDGDGLNIALGALTTGFTALRRVR